MAVNRILGVTKGVVVDTDDPAGFHRVKVRIIQLHGCFDESVYGVAGRRIQQVSRISDDCLPWAEVNYPYGSDITPEINQVVLISFINGDPDKPVVLGWLGYEYTTNENKLELD